MTSKKDLSAIRAEIRQLAAEGRSYNPRVQATRGMRRHVLRRGKASVGSQARMVILVYGFLRGVPYRTFERRCFEDSTPWLRRDLLRRIQAAVGRRRPEAGPDVNEAVKAWFEAEALEAEEAA